MTMVQNIFENDEQNKLFRDYHTKSNHRGITEALAHLKKSYYFQNMKNKITHVINNLL